MAAAGGEKRRRRCAIAVWVVLLVAAFALDAALQGSALHPVGYWALYLVVFFGLNITVQRRLTRDDSSWFWRHGTYYADEFTLSGPADAVRSAVMSEVTARRSWRLVHRAELPGIQVLIKPSLWGAMHRLDVSWHPVENGTQVSVWSRTPSVVNWGSDRRLVAKVRELLGGSAGGPT